MIIVYTPEVGEVEQFNVRKILTSEASIVANTVGMSWAQIKGALAEDDPAALRGIVWAMKKRTNPTLRFKEFDPPLEELVAKWDRREIADYIAEAYRVEATDEERADAFRILVRNAVDIEEAQAQVDEAKATASAPKEPPAKKTSTSKSGA